ncbi:Ig-like domain-containing protein [Kibdelosporangium philippinense]|uniref:Ig-like domain-containing protein n=2 Tax=Kibdelosporangium philippinense TaxID=211113 RepID=A0ABS8ZDH2_9PSEU|nr:Ig-like domain-containing protein [Kibdelosporangium philippinense]MCE7004915.1 Ig-like domain-containing protein [Kibdelosporangium philippinense]
MSSTGKAIVTGAILVTALVVGACSTSSGETPGLSGSSSTAAALRLDITPGGDASLPTAPIVVHANNGTIDSVTATNSAKGTKVKGSLSDDKMTWTSSEPLAYGATYDVVADGTSSDGKKSEQKSVVKTITPKATAYPSFIPAPNVTEAGVGQPIVVKFDKDIADKAAAEKALTVTSSPEQPGGWYWLNKREVHYRPQNYWQAGTTIKVHAGIYGVDLGGGTYGQTDRDLTLKVHDSWVAKADGNTEQMQIFQNGNLVKTMPISMGKDATPTHVGIHVISDKQREYTMDSCTYGVCSGPQAYRSLEHFAERISNDGEFVHENPNSVGAQGSSNVSHGCINLNAANAQWFFDHFGLGDVVEVANSGGPTLPVWDTYGDWAVSWLDWVKGSAVK